MSAGGAAARSEIEKKSNILKTFFLNFSRLGRLSCCSFHKNTKFYNISTTLNIEFLTLSFLIGLRFNVYGKTWICLKFNFLCGGPKKSPAHPEKNPGDGAGNGLYMLLYKLYLGCEKKIGPDS